MTGTDVQPPPELPKYLAEGLPKQDVTTLHETVAYVEELIAEKERAVEPSELPDDADPVEETNRGYVVEELVKCGKDGCKCASGNEAEMHGPYRYRYYRDDSGALQKEYADNQ